MFYIKILSVLRYAIDCLLNADSVFRMGSFQNQLNTRLGFTPVFKNTKCFFRPVDLTSGNIPAEAAGLAELLRFCQVGFVAPQFFRPFHDLDLEQVTGLAQFHFLVLKGLLRPLPIGDVSARSEPFHNRPVAVPDRRSARLKPAVSPVAPANTVFHVIRLSPRYRFRPELPGRLTVIRMQRFHPAPAEQVALPDAGIVCPLGAEVVAPAIRAGAPHQLRQCFGKASPALLVLPQRLLRPPSRSCEPAHDQRQ